MDDSASDEQILDAFRRWGYLQADLDSLGRLEPQKHPALEVSGPQAEWARDHYCGPAGVEFMHIPDSKRCRWIQERMEEDPEPGDQSKILDRLIQAEILEEVLQKRYLGNKRFSIEGLAALIPLLDEILKAAGGEQTRQAVIAMSHRGRLNVMVNIVGRSPEEVFAGFEDVDPRSVLGSGDVKYHLGATGRYPLSEGTTWNIHLVSNPSHLEAVSAVALGRVRAKQKRLGEDAQARILPIIIHGDAGFAGQGVASEALNLANLDGFSVGGAVHIIVNNLIGFTTEPRELHSSIFASDVAKRLPIPIFHVNGEAPEAVVRVGRLAVQYRECFSSDVVIDLIGYRRHGHSEVDDPTITQPLLYQKIKEHPPLWESYAEQIQADRKKIKARCEEVRSQLREAQGRAAQLEDIPVLRQLPNYWTPFKGGRYEPSYDAKTGLPPETLEKIADGVTRYPDDFNIHPKVKKLLEQRAEMGQGRRPVDFGMAEALALGSLVLEEIPVRLSGQDSRRGTFNQRHAVLVDAETEKVHIPLSHLASEQASFEIYNSMLSEAGVLAYEYGYSRDSPEALVLWEAQFGDFANGAQIIIDQFVASGEDKWNLLSGLVLLLPHGYEGQGPEHSSARIERFLQLAAEDNMILCQPSTAAQYFHLLRRQALSAWRKPLVIFTPKSLLRAARAASELQEFSRSGFLRVRPDQQVEQARRLIVCTGKIGHELEHEREQRQDRSTAIVFLEQFYPFPEAELRAELDRHPQAGGIVWVQEEPSNMGPLPYLLPRLERLSQGRPVRSVKRSPSASPATGSARAHQVEQKALVNLAFEVPL